MSVPLSIRLQMTVKRIIDVLAAFSALVLVMPLLVGIAAAIKLEDPRSPLFFNDWVMGRAESRFRMLKFRTMIVHKILYTDRPEVRGNSPLVTRVGAALRRWKLDELPQLLNVLSGQMSLVGPRPMDPHRFAQATPFQRQRLLVRPGLTGWAQINGNIHWSWSQRMMMDVWYLDRWSLALDLRILASTVPAIVAGERPGDQRPEWIDDDTYRVAWPGAGRFRRGNSLEPADKVART